MKLLKQVKILVTAVALMTAANAQATPINSTGLLTNGVVFGSGNANGSFTGVNENGIELGLRGKLRYDLNGSPQNIFNYDGEYTYNFDPAESNAPANRSIWNFEFSIDASSTPAGTLADSGYRYFLGVDTDPTAAVSFAGGPMGFDPLIVFADNAGGLGVAQNSQNLGFGYTGLDPQLEGIYTISLMAVGANETISTSINIVVGALEVSEPSTIALGALALGLLGFSRTRARK